jgi:hypothetical protein
VTTITKSEFSRICRQIEEDREIIIRSNPIGTREEILLWMLLGVLVSYLNLSEMETPCFSGKPDTDTYRGAIRFILNDRMADDFDPDEFLMRLT